MDRKIVTQNEVKALRESGRFVVPMVNWETFVSKVAKLARRAAKLELPEVSVEVVEELAVRGRCTCNMAGECEPDCKSHQLAEFNLVSLVGPEKVRLDGWKLVASVEHTRNSEEDNFVDLIGKFEGQLPESAFHGAPHCDHCGTNRWRKKTYFVEGTEGELVQVGSTCLKDFTGHANAEAIAKFSEYVMELEGSDQDPDEWFGGSGSSLTSVRQILAYSSLVIRTDGWVSAS